MKKILLTLLVMLSLVGCTITEKKETYTEPVEIDYNEFQIKIENKESFVLFMWQTGCSHCEAFEPTVTEVVKEKDILIYSINLAELTENEYAKIENKTFIKGTPTTIYVKEGKVQSTKLVGNKSKEELIEFLKNYKLVK